MRYGLAAWGLREESLDSQLKIAKSCGVDLLEFSIANYGKDALQLGASDAEISEVKRAFAASGIELMCGCTGNDFTGNDVKAQIAKVNEVIAIAEKLHLKFLRIFSGFASDSAVYGPRFDAMLAALAEVQNTARKAGITLCVETHGGVQALDNGALLHFHSVSTRVDYWEKILQTGVAICFDPANLAAVGIPAPCAFYKKFAPHIPYVHLKDFRDVPGGVTPAACGEGRLDWGKLLSAMKDYAGPALIEYELPADVADGMKRSLEFLKVH